MPILNNLTVNEINAGPSSYIGLTNGQNGLVKDTTTMPNLSGVSIIGPNCFCYTYYNQSIQAGSGETYFKPFASGTNIRCNYNSLVNMFYGAQFTNTEVSLEGISWFDSSSATTMFYGSNITKIYFPGLTHVENDSFGSFSYSFIFTFCDYLTEIHFPASMQSAIEAMNGYSSKWDASNATIYFDL